jgi:hypothetical protein
MAQAEAGEVIFDEAGGVPNLSTLIFIHARFFLTVGVEQLNKG